ncbi:MAG TPA: acyl-CoA dehydrogenase [Rhodospirillaceae bacterium]|nr:acyl-CoA dehydrogenase [Candidatus Neomarinimicrobiota bacterium]HCX13793.1 acyl-CoA dehydrogenase [Rhodospirillaceae bacterium]|tara:strand:- start:161 stop:1960 length:1800 start_codon:yes stop_codon:yes gene_type:complete
MATYKAPLRDMRFVYQELFNGDDLKRLPGYEDFSADVVEAVLKEAGKLAEEVLFPLNSSGDIEGCTFENGVVRTPTGFKEAYNQFIEGGWTGLGADPAYGGQGAPKALNILVEEMICSSNMSFGMYPGLTHGAYDALTLYGTEEQKQLYLTKFVKGTWSGTMCLTEPQCGTDLGLIRTKAVPQSDDSMKITGTKIFISAGEHDLTENIVHLVLAKLPDAPPGVKGISLFLVPKFLPKPDGSVGPRNGVACGSIENKMGIKASSTCVINFDDAQGWLVGEKHKGMRAMFAMMNTARLGVGVQGLGLSEAAYQGAIQYARGRLQGRGLKGAVKPDKPADPLLVHPDVRKNLLTIKALTEGTRALVMWVAMAQDKSEKAENEADRLRHDDLVQLMTPVVKAFGTDSGFDNANLGLQVYGGHGYIREHGMEQYVRDARITQIYEGTNGIQALDFVGRKMSAHYGRYMRSFFHPVQQFIEDNASDPEMEDTVIALAKAFGRLQQAVGSVAQKGMSDPDEAGAAATDLLKLTSYVAVGFMWARMTKIALSKQGDDPTGFYKGKLATGRFYMTKLLPQTGALLSSILAGGSSIIDIDNNLFNIEAA